MSLTIGVDVGGTKIAAAVVDRDGAMVASARRDTPESDAEAVEAVIADVCEELRADHDVEDDVEAVGIGAAGFVDKSRSTVLFAPNLSWRNVPLRAGVERRTGLPTVIENDANVAAWGEFAFGSGKDVDDLVLVTVGTGIGGGVVVDGELYRGSFGIAGEIGHLRVVPGGHLCGCGNRGCWEQYGSGTALEREAREVAAIDSPRSATLVELADGNADQISGPMVTEAARYGDPLAVELVQTMGRWLGEGIASLTAVLDTAVVAIGGGVAEAGELVSEPVRTAFHHQLTGRGFRPELEIRLASLGNEAGVIGAADLARR
ncbi:MAG: ROK family glucokinase [Nocardioidaceae bacterium]